jgi:hypothetical protein
VNFAGFRHKVYISFTLNYLQVMKKLVILFLFFPVLCSAQTKSDIFNPKVPVVYFGADFSRVQFTKSDEFTNKSEILRFFVDCNNLVNTKFNINIMAKRLERDSIASDFSYVTKNNAMVDWQKVFSDNVDYIISDEAIGDMIKALKINQSAYKDHIGIVFCEENYCKTKPLQTIAIVFFRVNDLNPLFIKHYTPKPGGFGFLNYWGLNNALVMGSVSKLKKEIE